MFQLLRTRCIASAMHRVRCRASAAGARLKGRSDALANSKVWGRLADLGREIFPRDRQTPKALGAFQKAEVEKWWPIIKAANIRAE